MKAFILRLSVLRMLPSKTTPQYTRKLTESAVSVNVCPFRFGHRPMMAVAIAELGAVGLILAGFVGVPPADGVVVGTTLNWTELVTLPLEITKPVGARLRVCPSVVMAGPPTKSVVLPITAVLPLSGWSTVIVLPFGATNVAWTLTARIATP